MPTTTVRYYDRLFALIPGFLHVGALVAPKGYGSPKAAEERIQAFIDENGENIEGLDFPKKAELLAIIHTAAISGLNGFPVLH